MHLAILSPLEILCLIGVRLFSRGRLALVAGALALTACASNPIALAETPAQKYAAVKLTYDAVLSVAVPLIEDSAVPINARRALQTAVADSGEVYRTLNQGYIEYLAARSELAAGATASARLDIATANLERWLAALEQNLDRVVDLTR